MSIWSRLQDYIARFGPRFAQSGLSALFGAAAPPEKSMAFTVAVVALGAKISKSDGQVTRDEVAAFRRVFTIEEKDRAAAGRFFNLARRDAAGYELYAERVAKMFSPGALILEDLLDGLFYIAAADGYFHGNETAFLRHIAELFGIDARAYERIAMRHAPADEACPYTILGVAPDIADEDLRAVRRALIAQNHPDKLRARGLPVEALKMAEQRMASINAAYDEIRHRRDAR